MLLKFCVNMQVFHHDNSMAELNSTSDEFQNVYSNFVNCPLISMHLCVVGGGGRGTE